MEAKISASIELLRQGVSVIPTRKFNDDPEWTKEEKKPALSSWRKYQNELMDEVTAQMAFSHHTGIAVVCGKVSGFLEILDFDEKYNINNITLLDKWRENLANDALYNQLVIQTTPAGGWHAIYRCPEGIDGNQKIASRAGLPDESSRVLALMETRGEGGYALIDPSPGYTFIQGNVSTIPTLTASERDEILKAAAMMNDYDEPVYSQSASNYSSPLTNMGLRPGVDYDARGDHKELLEAHGWALVRVDEKYEFWCRPGREGVVSASWNKATRRLSVFSTSTEFQTVLGTRDDARGINKRPTYSLFGMLALMRFKGDMSATAKFLFKEGYGKLDLEQIRQTVVNEKGQVVENDYPKFWTERVNEKSGEITYTIDTYMLIHFMEAQGFGKILVDKDYQIIEVKNNIVREVSAVHIKDYCRQYVESLPDELLSDAIKPVILKKMFDRIEKLFGKSFLELLKVIDLRFVKDTPTKAHFFYENCFVVVEASEGEEIITQHDYTDLNGHVWLNQRIARPFGEADEQPSEFQQFLENVCSSIPEGSEERQFNEKKFESTISAIGYLLHRYKDKSRTKAVILCDEKLSDNPSGRTGKGLICTALQCFRNTLRIDARNFKFEGAFMFQSVNQDTDVIEFNDCVKYFPFERLFGMITEDMNIEKKNRDAFVIKFKDSPKIILSTNYAIQGEGPSFRGRVHELELSDYYTNDYSPLDEFKHRFFDDWDEEEWRRFDMFILRCEHFYLNNGLVKYDTINIGRKKITQATSSDFVSFADERYKLGVEYGKKEEYEKWIEESSEKIMKMNSFSRWLRLYGEYKEWRISERRSNSKMYFGYVNTEHVALKSEDSLPF